jgi:hypothetical protein
MHDVKFKIPERDLGRADVEFNVTNGGSKIGTLKVSKGAVEWVPKDHTFGYNLNWKTFDIVMQERGVRAR